jgi:hypothetical protein
MTTYYLPPPPAEGMTAFSGVVNEYGGWIPDDPGNSDWIAYQAWLEEGNTAEAWPSGGPTFVKPGSA